MITPVGLLRCMDSSSDFHLIEAVLASFRYIIRTEAAPLPGSRLQDSVGRPASCRSEESHLWALEDRARQLEETLGEVHPQVGNSWLCLSKALQEQGTPEHAAEAEHALIRYTSCLTMGMLRMHGSKRL